jgi:putative hydrolases of HD superfamily
MEKLYDAAHIQRWNDHLRTKGFTELDKQSHKMVIAYVLGKCEEDSQKAPINWNLLLEMGFFEFIKRVILTDIKPAIFHEMVKVSGPELNQWIWQQCQQEPSWLPPELYSKLESYLSHKVPDTIESKILKAAHYYSTLWEFNVIYPFNKVFFNSSETREQLDNEWENHSDLIGMQKLGMQKNLYRFLDMVGQLRFQQRWSRTPRIPETSVLGHMLIVAWLSWICSYELSACPKRSYHNFFTGLFHDIPEILTRDIVSPIKKSIGKLEELISGIEDELMKTRIYPLLPRPWHEEFHYWVDQPFINRIRKENQCVCLSPEQIGSEYNMDYYDPLDGQMVKSCDLLSAFTEAYFSLKHGIRSRELKEACNSLEQTFQDRSKQELYPFEQVLEELRQHYNWKE